MNKLKKAGFTIVELVIVILIITTLVAIIIPNFIGMVSQAEIATTKANLQSIKVASQLYFVENNRHWPGKIQNIVDSGYLKQFPQEAITPAKTEINAGGVDGTGGWYFEFVSDDTEPVIFVNLNGNDRNGEPYSTY